MSQYKSSFLRAYTAALLTDRVLTVVAKGSDVSTQTLKKIKDTDAPVTDRTLKKVYAYITSKEDDDVAAATAIVNEATKGDKVDEV